MSIMPNTTLSPMERKAYALTHRLLSTEFRVTPSSRSKIDRLALWLAEGDRTKVRSAKRSVMDLLCAARS
jgi:hypothetical protein